MNGYTEGTTRITGTAVWTGWIGIVICCGGAIAGWEGRREGWSGIEEGDEIGDWSNDPEFGEELGDNWGTILGEEVDEREFIAREFIEGGLLV